jgi:segregation and condensation protein B
MIRVAGRKNVVGSPFLYRTTRDFLVHFGLNDIQDLPRLEEFADLIGENIVDDLASMPTQVGMFDDGTSQTSSSTPPSETAAMSHGRGDEAAGEESSVEPRTDDEEMYEDREGTVESDAIDEHE